MLTVLEATCFLAFDVPDLWVYLFCFGLVEGFLCAVLMRTTKMVGMGWKPL